MDGATVVAPLITRETLDLETPARAATASRVGLFTSLLGARERFPKRVGSGVRSSQGGGETQCFSGSGTVAGFRGRWGTDNGRSHSEKPLTRVFQRALS
ncbi:hypothetical protein GCM10009850_053870 [Nonomuraea monospora]|uniref:Uncharacterized protein n=1 Tax=Nonomuraea monospora TaxID=568818 RepID=A0ABN3CKN4_9ACTN